MRTYRRIRKDLSAVLLYYSCHSHNIMVIRDTQWTNFFNNRFLSYIIIIIIIVRGNSYCVSAVITFCYNNIYYVHVFTHVCLPPSEKWYDHRRRKLIARIRRGPILFPNRGYVCLTIHCSRFILFTYANTSIRILQGLYSEDFSQLRINM